MQDGMELGRTSSQYQKRGRVRLKCREMGLEWQERATLFRVGEGVFEGLVVVSRLGGMQRKQERRRARWNNDGTSNEYSKRMRPQRKKKCLRWQKM